MPIVGWVILGLILLTAFWGIVIYNRLVAMRQQCDQAFANVDVQLRRRHDLVPNLVETVKGYAGHERGALDSVVQARNAALAARDIPTKAVAENVLTGALRQLFALSERYPNLKANENFQQLQTDLTGIENSLAEARRAFNDMVRGNNTMIQQFPNVVFARFLGFGPHEFFTVANERQSLERGHQVRF